MKVAIIFSIFMFLSGISYGKYLFFDYKINKPLFVSFQTSTAINDDEIIEIDENEELSPDWALTGSMIFISYDKINNKRYHGVQSQFMNSIIPSDWGKISYSIVASWKDDKGKKYSSEMAKGNFNDPCVRKIENDTFNNDDSVYVRDYVFYIVLNNVPYTFEMPLGEDTYKVNIEVKYPVMVWKKNGNVYKKVFLSYMISKTPQREIRVLDKTPPKISIIKGLDQSNSNCTTGDPLCDDIANVKILIEDNNPNAVPSDVTFESQGKVYNFEKENESRVYDIDTPLRYKGEYKLAIPNHGDDIITAPNDGTPLKFKISCDDGSGNIKIYESEIKNKDNDPPNIKFIFRGISAKIKKDCFDPIGQKAKIDIDMIDISSRKVLYSDNFDTPDPEPIILKTDKIIVAQNTRVLFQAFAYDNTDEKCQILMNGQVVSESGKRFIFNDYSKNMTVLEATDKANNKRKVIIPIHVKKMYFNVQTLGN